MLQTEHTRLAWLFRDDPLVSLSRRPSASDLAWLALLVTLPDGLWRDEEP